MLFIYAVSEANFFKILWYVLLGLAVIDLIGRIIEYKSTEFIVTNKRVIMKRGFIRRSVFEQQLDKSESIAFTEPFWGRIFGYGSMLVSTVGSEMAFTFIKSHVTFKKEINEAIEDNKENK